MGKDPRAGGVGTPPLFLSLLNLAHARRDRGGSILLSFLPRATSGRRSLSSTSHTHTLISDATFADGIMIARGPASIAAQFAALATLFKHASVTADEPPSFTYGTDEGPARATRTAAVGAGQAIPTSITLPNTQAFTLKGPLPLHLVLDVTTTLTLDPATGRISRHVDAWQNIHLPPWFMRIRRLPLFAAPSPIRAVNGWVSSSLLKLAGHGKMTGSAAPAGAATAGRAHQE